MHNKTPLIFVWIAFTALSVVSVYHSELTYIISVNYNDIFFIASSADLLVLNVAKANPGDYKYIMATIL